MSDGTERKEQPVWADNQLWERSRGFLKETEKHPPTKKRALELYRTYIQTLKDLDEQGWRRFFSFFANENTANELAMRNTAVAKAFPADHAYHLLSRIEELDLAWWVRHRKLLTKFATWLVGAPILGKAFEWLFNHWDQLSLLIGTSTVPIDIFQSEEYTFLAVAGAWIALSSSTLWSRHARGNDYSGEK